MLSGRRITVEVSLLALSVCLLQASCGLCAGPDRRWEGTLDVGSVRYGVSMGFACPTGGVARAEVRVSLHGREVGAGISEAVCGLGARRVDRAAAAFMFSDAGLTESEITDIGYKKVGSSGIATNAWWESVDTVRLLDDLPVRIRLFLEACGGDAGRGRCRATKITVYSMGEWNNRLNDNLVLRLERLEGD